MGEDEAESDSAEPNADEVPTLDGQPIFNSGDPDETRSSDDSNQSDE